MKEQGIAKVFLVLLNLSLSTCLFAKIITKLIHLLSSPPRHHPRPAPTPNPRGSTATDAVVVDILSLGLVRKVKADLMAGIANDDFIKVCCVRVHLFRLDA